MISNNTFLEMLLTILKAESSVTRRCLLNHNYIILNFLKFNEMLLNNFNVSNRRYLCSKYECSWMRGFIELSILIFNKILFS